jgi:hypothetical protein
MSTNKLAGKIALVTGGNVAIGRIKKLSTATVCSTCGTNYEDSAFCTTCGTNISGAAISDESLFRIVHAELPDACPNWDEFLVLKAASPERGVLVGLLGVGLAQVIRKHGIGSIE